MQLFSFCYRARLHRGYYIFDLNLLMYPVDDGCPGEPDCANNTMNGVCNNVRPFFALLHPDDHRKCVFKSTIHHSYIQSDRQHLYMRTRLDGPCLRHSWLSARPEQLHMQRQWRLRAERRWLFLLQMLHRMGGRELRQVSMQLGLR